MFQNYVKYEVWYKNAQGNLITLDEKCRAKTEKGCKTYIKRMNKKTKVRVLLKKTVEIISA